MQLEHFQEYQKSVLNEIGSWKYQQKLAHCGYPEPGPLDEVKKQYVYRVHHLVHPICFIMSSCSLLTLRHILRLMM